ncbi:unnamed protein product [Brachionus calyciflorus]|uniref:Ricin B lectin domain-containing protein n=1 Tax=Brachionus calyciflorus TaxID=104777 RepID=A0A813VDM4_9BILA|nr:unnamed protein product [Brachionus calyciflorus]
MYGLETGYEKTGDFKIKSPALIGKQADGKWEIKYFDVNWNQFWTWEDKGDGYYQIVNRRSKKCLEVDDKRLIYKNGAILQQWSCYGNNNQLWRKNYFPGGTFQIVNKKSKRCIDIPGWGKSNGVRLWQWRCLDQANQKWQMHSNGLKNLDSHKCLDLPDHELYNLECNNGNAFMLKKIIDM